MEIIPAQTAEHALRVKLKYKEGSEWSLFLYSDAHLDSPESYPGLLEKHLDEAKERGAMIISAGDNADIIGTRGDPRGSKGAVRPENQGVDHIDRVERQLSGFFSPYADNLLYWGEGNHDKKVTIEKETDLHRRIWENLNRARNPKLKPIHRGGYTGWIRFEFEHEAGGNRFSHSMKVEHGNGQGGKIMAKKRMGRSQGVTWFVSGHLHDREDHEIPCEYLNAAGRVCLRPVNHIQLGSYKGDFRLDGCGTWFHMKSGEPKPLGGSFINMWIEEGELRWRSERAWTPYSKLEKYRYTRGKTFRAAA